MIGNIIKVGIMLFCGAVGIGSFGQSLAGGNGLIVGTAIGVTLAILVPTLNYKYKAIFSWMN